ncbi:MAG TPA: hypothetical protein VEO01_24300, partial [Pseudonocardiaceae bacterium]|nr:hypothetical protein [Pseudonocardiaceae bacterium]
RRVPHRPGKDTASTMTATAHTTAIDPASDAADTARESGEWLVGDYYDQTADWPLNRVADRVQQDLYDVRYDHMLPATAEFEVTPDTEGPIPVLRVTITGLVGTVDSPPIYAFTDSWWSTRRCAPCSA